MATTYSEETLKEAVRLVQEDGWSYGEAMKSIGVPKTTIYSYAKSTVVARKRRGRDPSLTNEEEICLVQWIIMLSKVGFPVTDDDVLANVPLLLHSRSTKHALKFHPVL